MNPHDPQSTGGKLPPVQPQHPQQPQAPGPYPQQPFPQQGAYPPQPYAPPHSAPQNDAWQWGWSPFIGIHYGPIPIGLIVGIVILVIVAVLGGFE